MPVPVASSDRLVGTVLDGRYSIESPLGEGGMGVVYRAHQISVGRDVAVKVVSEPAMLDETAAARLVREGKIAGAVSHPGIVTLIDLGHTPEGLPYLVMELVPGRSLKDILRDGPLAVDRALSIARQLADALAAVHALGVVHRDLKPGNVMVIEDEGGPKIKVLDFGLAKGPPGDAEGDITRSDVIIGTLRYLAPEVLFGSAPDQRSDIHALGVVLYEMVAGRPPYVGSNVMTLAARMASGPPDPLPACVPSVVAGLIDRMIANEPDARLSSALQTRELLDAARESLFDATSKVTMDPAPSEITGPVPPSPALEAAQPPPRRRGLSTAWIATIAVLGLSATALGAGLLYARSAAPRGAHDGDYRGLYFADSPPCSDGRLEMNVDRSEISGVAEGVIVVKIRGEVSPTGECRGEIFEGTVKVGTFEGRFEGGRGRGTTRDQARGCGGTWEALSR